MTEPRLCVALDNVDPGACERLARLVAPRAGMLKLGAAAFVAGGGALVARVGALRPVFLDLKLHDIPAQVGGAIAAVGRLGVAYATVHAAGGAEMVRAAIAAAPDGVTVLAVTVLTSLDDAALGEVGVSVSVRTQVLRLAELALDAGAPGLVCSPHEVAELRARFGAPEAGGPVLVVPGIRPAGAEHADQRRAASPRAAVEAGADVVVVGRPIAASPDPAAAAAAVAAEIAASRAPTGAGAR